MPVFRELLGILPSLTRKARRLSHTASLSAMLRRRILRHT